MKQWAEAEAGGKKQQAAADRHTKPPTAVTIDGEAAAWEAKSSSLAANSVDSR